MLSEAMFKAAALNQLYPWKGLLCPWALPEQQSEASEAFRFHQGCPCQPPPPHQMALPFQSPQDPLTCGYLSAGSTRLSMARTKAAVLPVPDCDWAIRFCGLDPGGTEMRITLVRNNQVSKCSFWAVGKGIFPSFRFSALSTMTIFLYVVKKKNCLNIKGNDDYFRWDHIRDSSAARVP